MPKSFSEDCKMKRQKKNSVLASKTNIPSVNLRNAIGESHFIATSTYTCLSYMSDGFVLTSARPWRNGAVVWVV